MVIVAKARRALPVDLINEYLELQDGGILVWKNPLTLAFRWALWPVNLQRDTTAK